mmetsp:Transcript_1960/g.5228  ORF Transcript_1960/g.5228 Transcript_1960/m.5228 type:complete len:498 (+) Transcript_1960:782-2275(+)
MLHSLRERIVGALGNADTVHHVERLSRLVGHGLFCILAQHLAPAEQIQHRAECPLGVRLEVDLGIFVRLLGNQMQIGRRAKIRQAGACALLAQVPADRVHRQRHLHVQGAVQIRVAPHRELLPRIQLHEPVPNPRRLREQIAARMRVHLLLPRARLRSHAHRKRQRAARLLRDPNQTLPNIRAVQIDSHHVGAQRHQHQKRPHRGTRSQQDKVPVRHIQIPWIIDALHDGFPRAGLDRAVLDPAADLRLEAVAGQGLALVRDPQLVRAAFRARSLDKAREEPIRPRRRGHGGVEGSRGAVRCDELEEFVRLGEAGGGDGEGGVGGLALLVDEGVEVAHVAEAPVFRGVDAVGFFGAGGAHCGGNDGLVDVGAAALALGVEGPFEAAGGWGRFGEAFLEGAFAVHCHVEYHEGGAEEVDDGEELAVEEGCEGGEDGDEGGVGGGGEEDGHFADDAGGVEKREEGVAQPEEREGRLFGGVAGEERGDVEGVTRNLGGRP